MLIWLCRKREKGRGKKNPNSKNKNKKQNKPKPTNKQRKKLKRNKCFEKCAVSSQQNQSVAYMILLTTDDITGLKISKISTEATS